MGQNFNQFAPSGSTTAFIALFTGVDKLPPCKTYQQKWISLDGSKSIKRLVAGVGKKN